LARGIYRVTVIGAKGYAPPTPIALSRDQNVELMVFSYLDMGVLGSIGVIIALGLLFFGRPHLMMDTITFPVRAITQIQKFRPVMVKEFYDKIIAFGSRIVSKKGNVRLENGSNITNSDDIAYIASVYPMEREETISADDIAIATPSAFSEELSSPEQANVPVMVAEQENPSIELSEPEAIASAAEVDQAPIEVEQNDLAAPTEETAGVAVEDPVTRVCQVCGSSQLVKKETKRRQQERYQCQACGASNNFGAKRIRKHRQKNRAESLV
jgi:predicted RNA-binding Zn-ribbon protein involved in translation (DUF1610 family)